MLMMITKGPHEGSILNIQPEKPAVLGRRGSVPLLDHLASKRHACLYCDEEGHWFINDLGSTNGTFVNNELIAAPTRLCNGDAVQIGKTSMVVGGVGGDPDFNHALIGPTQKDEQRQLILAANRAMAVPVSAPLGAPVDFVEQPPPAALGVVRRWIPVMLMAVLLLIILSQGAVYLRMQQSIDAMRSDVSQQKNDFDPQDVVDAVEQKLAASADAQRITVLQDVTTLMATQQEQQLAKLDETLRARLAEHDAALQDRLKPPPAPPANPWPVTAASTFQQPLQAVFFVDCSRSLVECMPLIHEEISRELTRIEQRDQTRIFLYYASQLIEIPGMHLDSFPREHAGIMALLYSRNPQIILHDNVANLNDALAGAIEGSPAQMFLLSDGLFPLARAGAASPQQALKTLNPKGNTRIHAIHFFSKDGGAGLRAIARENQGSYSFIPSRGG